MRPSLRASMNSTSPRRSRYFAPAVLGQEPEADEYRRRVEELTGHDHHAVHQGLPG